MARFDVYLVGDSMVVDVQANIVDHFATRIVVPLMEAGQSPPALKRLHPRFEIGGRTLVLATHLLGAVPLVQLKRSDHNLAARRDEITAALDMLFQGF